MTADELKALSIVVPVFDEEEVIAEFNRRVLAVLAPLPYHSEIIYVNDGSRDRSADILRALCAENSSVSLLDLSRNFGKEIALTAGLDYAEGDAVVVIDADLQDPPEMIPNLIAAFLESGCDVVYAQRSHRDGETWFKKATAYAFYRLINRVSRIQIPNDVGDFRILSRRAVNALVQLREHHRFMKGLFAWIGFRQMALSYERDRRFAGDTKFSYGRLWDFSLEGITSFTIAPLKLATYVGIASALVAGADAVRIVVRTLILGNPVPGYPSLFVAILFLGGLQLTTLGVIGEYLGRVFNESKRRPLYFVQGFHSSRASSLQPPVQAPETTTEK